MKTVLVHIRDDSGLDGRLAAALAVTRALDAHLACVQVTPYTAFVIADPLGGMFVSPSVLEALHTREDAVQTRVEEAVAKAGLTSDWYRFDGDAARAVISRARLADLAVLSLRGEASEERATPLPIVGDVAIYAGAPVLALPRDATGFAPDGPAMVAWNGAIEAAHSLRAAVPLLRLASAVHIVTVADDDIELPASEARLYLSRHGIAAETREWPRKGNDVPIVLMDAAAALDARYMVMGAYGHSRLRESILGGVTGTLVARSRIPLLLAH